MNHVIIKNVALARDRSCEKAWYTGSGRAEIAWIADIALLLSDLYSRARPAEQSRVSGYTATDWQTDY